jgi:hypothetical protein
MSNEFTIELSGADGFVGVDALVEALENTIAGLRSLESHFVAADAIRWEVVRASMNSPLKLTIAPRSARPVKKREEKKIIKAGGDVARAYIRGINTIGTSAVRPEFFDDDALESAKRLAGGPGKSETTLTLFVPDEDPVTPSANIAANVSEVVARVKPQVEYGTIEGTLEVFSRHNGDSISVWDRLTKNKVECTISEKLIAKANEYVLQKALAEVAGQIKSKNGKPISMIVESITPILSGRTPLLKPWDMPRIDITGGKSSEDFVRELRDG